MSFLKAFKKILISITFGYITLAYLNISLSYLVLKYININNQDVRHKKNESVEG